jgi:C-terminal processing protease CtpA/Prc
VFTVQCCGYTLGPSINEGERCRGPKVPETPKSNKTIRLFSVLSGFARCADWDQKLQQTMVEMFPLKSEDAAYGKIRGMLATLGDPFTKIITPKVPMIWGFDVCYQTVTNLHMAVEVQEYQSFRIGSDGNVQGVGVFINREPSYGRLVS